MKGGRDRRCGWGGRQWSGRYVAGEEAGWVEDGAAAAGEREALINAGFSRSIDTVSLQPLRSNVYNLSDLSRTANGPSYGCCNGFLTVSRQTNTCVAVGRELSI